MKVHMGFAVASCLLLSTCGCPTLWLTITKTDPPPRISAAAPRIAANPVPRPPTLTNRCDVFQHGHPCVFAENYTDYIDAQGNALATWSSAKVEFEKVLKSSFGTPLLGTPDKADCSEGTVVCSDQNTGCIGVRTKDSLHQTAFAQVQAGTRPPLLVTVTQPRAAGGTFHVIGQKLEAEGFKPNDPVTLCMQKTSPLSHTLLSFIHMSDIQIRDGSVKLEDAELSRHLDKLIQSFEYDPDLEQYNPYVVAALFATINASVRNLPRNDPERPRFIMHTGDSIDAGVTTELRLFHSLVHTLVIPLFEVIGNHDALAFGNLLPTDNAATTDGECATVKSIAPPTRWTVLTPAKICVDKKIQCLGHSCIQDEAKLIAEPTHDASVKNFIDGLRDPNLDTPAQIATDRVSDDHGFDLEKDTVDKGYYSFFQPLAFDDKRDAAALFVVLDSEQLDVNHGGTDGRMGPEQAEWLEHIVKCEKAHPYDMMFVFAHQPIGGIQYESPSRSYKSLQDVLFDSPNMVAYLYGHYHRHRICDSDGRRPKDSICSKFWEVETGSVIEFPQEARMVRIKQISSTQGFLEVFTFGEHLDPSETEFAKLVSLGRRGAERDYCRTQDNVSCSDDLRPYRDDGHDANARLFFKLPAPVENAAGSAAAPGPDDQFCKDLDDARPQPQASGR